jgi:hypothetical protein
MSDAKTGDGKTISPGFSPQSRETLITSMTASPSVGPETLSPNALTDGPVIDQVAAQNSGADFTFQNGTVNFKK